MKPLLLSALAAVSLSSTASAAAPKPGAPAGHGPCAAVHTLADAQGDFKIGDRTVKATWEWQKGTGAAAANAGGLVAVALARAPQSCLESAALERYALARVAEHRAGQFLFDPDVEALAVIGRRLNRPEWETLAKEAFKARYEGASAEESVARWSKMLHRGELLGYDAALAINAAAAVGENDFAHALGTQMAATMPKWSHGDDANGWLTASRGALLDALASLDAKAFPKAIAELGNQLLSSQESDGSFRGHNSQATAYAVRGLSRIDGPKAKGAAERGRAWLSRTQLSDGMWASFNDGLPEPFVGERFCAVTAEALLALTP